jgi:hypothetical protein
MSTNDIERGKSVALAKGVACDPLKFVLTNHRKKIYQGKRGPTVTVEDIIGM